MLAGRRVAVHVCRAGGFPQRARFEQVRGPPDPRLTQPSILYKSIVSHCCPPHEDGGIVHCALKSPQFLVSDREFPGSTGLLLKRPPFCPIKHLTAEQKASLPAETRRQGVDVGVAVLLESASAKLLLTRRARTLSLFPNTWVPPGGHIEPEEELLGAGLRELREETGLQLKDGEFSWQLLALWESVYPPRLSQGLPQRHHIVVYLHLALHESHRQLQARLKPNEAEVAAVAWLDRPTLASIAATEGGAEGEALGAGKGAPSTVSILELEKGSAKTLVIPTAAFLATAQGENMERVSSGTKYALRQWLNMSSF
ncbi:nucleoside diphosphate-linked moiety X motif 17 isoform X2 [Ahaetulla prasina]|uniref:nucleoside diphosphate-linked moiety X motif 17 isoform X2 n=1 Tax=Ahaetulla prasina TaxID=499056 RepID=UPI0026499F9E|nr:nucleoside diphosphate-linked moiety X motif 17 isoform X2 [Ahaetulla prasina]